MCKNLRAESAFWNIARVSVKLHTKCSNIKKNFILFSLIPHITNKLASEQTLYRVNKYDEVKIQKIFYFECGLDYGV